MSPASNTKDCFAEFVGQRVIGVLFDALPLRRRDIARGTKTLIFEDGRGLTISSQGTFWIEPADDVRRAVLATQRELEATERCILAARQLIGDLPMVGEANGA